MPSVRSVIVDDLVERLATLPGLTSCTVWEQPGAALMDGPWIVVAPSGEEPAPDGDEGGMANRLLPIEVLIGVAFEREDPDAPSAWDVIEPMVTAAQKILVAEANPVPVCVARVERFTIGVMDEDAAYLVASIPMTITYRHAYGDPEVAL